MSLWQKLKYCFSSDLQVVTSYSIIFHIKNYNNEVIHSIETEFVIPKKIFYSRKGRWLSYYELVKKVELFVREESQKECEVLLKKYQQKNLIIPKDKNYVFQSGEYITEVGFEIVVKYDHPDYEQYLRILADEKTK